jgi:hypothetical protein
MSVRRSRLIVFAIALIAIVGVAVFQVNSILTGVANLRH